MCDSIKVVHRIGHAKGMAIQLIVLDASVGVVDRGDGATQSRARHCESGTWQHAPFMLSVETSKAESF
eukprot:1398204-Amphidinium_carterae.1